MFSSGIPGNPNLSKEIRIIKNLKRGKELNIAVTYSSFQASKFRKIFNDDLKDFIVIFDEATWVHWAL